MNFYDNLCGIYDHANISLTHTWSQALQRQARQVLLPLYRKICVSPEWDEEEDIPLPTDFLLDAVSYAFNYGDLNFIYHWEIEKLAKDFLVDLPGASKELLAFYMYSTEGAIRTITQDIEDGIYDQLLVGVNEDQELATVFHHLIKQVKEADILQWLEGELGNLQNFFSVDLLLHWDRASVYYANEDFAKYLGLTTGEIKLFPEQSHEFYNRKEPHEIFIHTSNFSNHVPAKWYGPNLVPKGHHIDLGDRTDAIKNL